MRTNVDKEWVGLERIRVDMAFFSRHQRRGRITPRRFTEYRSQHFRCDAAIVRAMEPQPEEAGFLKLEVRQCQYILRDKFPFVMNLKDVFVFSEREERRAGCDGELQSRNYGKHNYMFIGESVLKAEWGYKILVILHELAHIQIWANEDDSHPDQFVQLLDSMIEEYNRNTGANIINDMEEMER